MVTVKISEKDGQQTTYQFDKPEITIGRMKGNDIVLPKGNVSKKHARLIDKGDDLQVDDLNSTNGTYVNGRKVTAQTKVTEDDKIYIGDFILQLQPESQQQAQSGPPSPPGADKPQPTGASGGPTNPPNQSKPGQSNQGKSRPNRSQPPSGASQPSASASKPGTSRSNQSQSGSTGANQSASASRPGARSEGGTPATGSTGGGKKKTDRGPAAKSSQGGSGSNSLDERFSSSGSDSRSSSSPAPPSPDSPSPESHSGGSGGPASGTGVSGDDRTSGPGSSMPGDRHRGDRPAADDDQRVPSRERPSVDDAGGRSPVSTSIDLTPRPLTDNFDEEFHELHRKTATALLNEVGGIDEFPIAYPPTGADRDAMRDHVSAALNAVNAGDETELLESLLLEEAVALGPVEDLLDDPEIDAIRVNGFDRIVTRRDNDIVRERLCFGDPAFLRLAAERLLGERAPTRATDRIRFSDGATARVVLPPVTLDEPILSIDSPVRATSLSNLVDDQCLTDRMADFLRAAVAGNQTVLTVSADDASRQRALAALCNELPASSQAVGLSESKLPGLDRPGSTQLDASPGEGWSRADVLDAARQLNPDRVVVDEIRNDEAAGWVRACISGAAGSLATIYGQTLEDGLDRLAAAGQSSAVSGGPLDRHELAAAVDVVLLVGRTHGARTRMVRIAELEDIDYDRFRLTDVFTYREDDGEAEFVETGYVPSFLDALDPADLPSVDSTLFGDGD